MPGTYRQRWEEIDKAGFVQPQVNITGFMPVISRKGRSDKPTLCQSEKDVLTNFGNPSSDYPSLFEAIAYCRKAPCWVVSGISDDALYGGVDVTALLASGFGAGRVSPDDIDYTSINTAGSDNQGQQDGKTQTWATTLTGIPLDSGTLKIKVGTGYLTVTDTAGVISGTDIDPTGTNTINYTTGTIDVKVNGTPGISEVYDIICEADTAGSLNNKYFWIFTSSKSYYIWFNVNSAGVDPVPTVPVGAPTIKTGVQVDLATGAINTAVATATQTKIHALADFTATIATATVTVTNVWGELIKEAEDGNTAWTIFTGFTPSVDGADSTGVMPRAGQEVIFEYVYNTDISTTVSHSFFASSPYADDLKIKVEWVTGSQFKLTLYKILGNVSETLREYEYSLIKEKNNFGRSIYIHDVFEGDVWLIPVINTVFNLTGDPFASFVDTTVSLSGGYRGTTPANSVITSTYDFLHKPNQYGAEIIMDPFGNDATTINTIIQTYQFFSQGITMIPQGEADATALVAVRSGLGLDTDDIGLYCNWSKIKDVYNDSYAWISNIGSIGGKYAWAAEKFGAESPAGVDQSGRYGGQLSDWRIVEMEFDFTEQINGDLQILDEAQINPFVFDEAYGLMARGDRTLQVSMSDTSYIGTKRLYKYIIKNIVLQILRKQEFKINDPDHRMKAKLMADDFMSPIYAAQYLREYHVICDESNNNDVMLEQRKFIIDIYVKVAPNSQFTLLKLTRMSQGMTLADILPG